MNDMYVFLFICKIFGFALFYFQYLITTFRILKNNKIQDIIK